MFGASENTIGYACDYMSIYACGTLFVHLTLGMGAFITAQGFAKEGMVTVLIGAVTNIVLDPIFIFGLNMGVKGAALATIISQFLSCIWVLKFLTGKKTMLRIKKEHLRINGIKIFAALFGTPVTATFFAIEVVSVGVMHYAGLVPCIISSFVASFIATFSNSLLISTGGYTAPFVMLLVLAVGALGLNFTIKKP